MICRAADGAWRLHDSRKAAGESGFCGLSCAGRSRPAHGRRRGGGPLLKKNPPCCRRTLPESLTIRSNLDIKLRRVIGGRGNGELQIEGARRRAGTRQEARADSASRSSAHFCRRIDSQGVDPRSLNWKISNPGKARNRSPARVLEGRWCASGMCACQSTNLASWLGSLGRVGRLVIRISLPRLGVLSNSLTRVMFRKKALDYFRFAIGP